MVGIVLSKGSQVKSVKNHVYEGLQSGPVKAAPSFYYLANK